MSCSSMSTPVCRRTRNATLNSFCSGLAGVKRVVKDVGGIRRQMCAFQRRTGAPNGADYNGQYQQQQHTSIRVDPRAELDEEVAMLGSSVSNLKFMARSINEEVKAQGTLIAQLVRRMCERIAMTSTV